MLSLSLFSGVTKSVTFLPNNNNNKYKIEREKLISIYFFINNSENVTLFATPTERRKGADGGEEIDRSTQGGMHFYVNVAVGHVRRIWVMYYVYGSCT